MEFEKLKKNVFWLGTIFVVIGAYFVLENFLPALPELNAQTSLALVFFIGLLTSFHCIAMCGSFVVGYSANCKKAAKKESNETVRRNDTIMHLQYSAGKLISYTLMGGIFGLLGSVIILTPQLRGYAAIIAGLFLAVFGLNLLNVFSFLKGFTIPIPKALAKIVATNKKRGPFAVGLLNGLMIACGPLQAMYIFAASTGSILSGASIMFAFGLGTVPLMLLFGLFVSKVSNSLSQKITRFSGVLVILLGFFLLSTGFALAGINMPRFGNEAKNIPATTIGQQIVPVVQEIKMEVNANGYSPSNFSVKQGIPVKWIINVTKLTSCNNEILVPELGITKKLSFGTQTIEFTPDKLGAIQFSCWMGMLRGSITVEPNSAVIAFSAADNNSAKQYYSANQATPKGCGCGGAK